MQTAGLCHLIDGDRSIGTLRYRGARIQVLDLPGIIEGAATGRGRGRQDIEEPFYCADMLTVLLLAQASDVGCKDMQLNHDRTRFRQACYAQIPH